MAMSMVLLNSATLTANAADHIFPQTPEATQTVSSQANASQKIKQNRYAVIDYTNANAGYVKVKYTAKSNKEVAAYIYEADHTYYLYQVPLTPDEWSTLPLSAGDGSYTIEIREFCDNIRSYVRLSLDLDVSIAYHDTLISNNCTAIDISTLEDGYASVKYTGQTDNVVYTYLYTDYPAPYTCIYRTPMTPGEWYNIPLVNGSGSYSISVRELIDESGNPSRFHFDFDVSIPDPLSIFLVSHNQIDYENAPNTVEIANTLTSSIPDIKEKIDAIYEYVSSHISFDYENFSTYPSNYVYITELDDVLTSGKGICGHYAAVMSGMLRCIGIPAKMEYGYTSYGVYHAWVSAYISDIGWVRYDPSQISICENAAVVAWAKDYIANDANFTTDAIC